MDVGSVADWVAAFGGVMSVGATSYIAIHERNRANRLEEIQAETEAVQRGAAIDEAQRITGEIICKYDALSRQQRFEGLEPYDISEYRDAIDVLRQQIASLQGFAGPNARLYVALGQIAAAAELLKPDVMTIGKHRFIAIAQAGLLKAKSEELDCLR